MVGKKGMLATDGSQRRQSRRWLLAGVLVLGMGSLAACPPAADVKGGGAGFSVDALPTDSAGLLRVADEQDAAAAPRNALTVLERAQKTQAEWAAGAGAYGLQWRLARTHAALSEPDGDQRATSVPAGLQAAKRATELSADRVEGHYYLAQLHGFSALLQKGETRPLLQSFISEAEAAIKIDDKFDAGGPLRIVGVLYARAPKEPVSVGDPEKAVQYMKRAVTVAPDYPPNQFFLAEAYVADERYSEAESALATARKLLADPKWDARRASWRDLLSRVERKLKAKQN
jgi:tetratricopeptide (TPR) repeat protein